MTSDLASVQEYKDLPTTVIFASFAADMVSFLLIPDWESLNTGRWSSVSSMKSSLHSNKWPYVFVPRERG